MDFQLSRKRQAGDDEDDDGKSKRLRSENSGSQEVPQKEQQGKPASTTNHSVLDSPSSDHLTPMEDSARKILTQKFSDSKKHSVTSLKTNAAKAKEAKSPEVDPDMALLCISDLISVPLPIIFRQALGPASSSTGQSRHRPLLSRNEAHCFLSISSVARQMDSLAALASRAFEQQHQLQDLRASLHVIQSRQPFLRSIFTLGNIVAHDLPLAAAARIEKALDEVVGKLRSSIPQLRQSSEQNWSIFESLQGDAVETTNTVAVEKKRIAEIQEEVLRRIESLLSDSPSEEQLSQSSANSKGINIMSCESMAEFCDRVFQDEVAAAVPTHFHSPTNDGATTPQRQSNSQSSRVSTGSKGPAPEKLLEETEKVMHGEGDQRDEPTSPAINETNDPMDDGSLTESRSPSPEALPFERTQATQNALEGLAELAAQPPPM